MRKYLFAALLVFVGFATAEAMSWIPMQEVRRHALVTFEGIQTRYQVHYFSHEEMPDQCIMLVVDTQTGNFDTTLLPMACSR